MGCKGSFISNFKDGLIKPPLKVGATGVITYAFHNLRWDMLVEPAKVDTVLPPRNPHYKDNSFVIVMPIP